MPKVEIVQVIYNNQPWIEPVFAAIFNQTFRDFICTAVIAGNSDGSKAILENKFPEVKIIDPGYNIGFAGGHNLVFANSGAEFFQLVNPDLILEPNYLEEMLKGFEDERVGAATGKLYKILNGNPPAGGQNFKSKILDTTGVIISKSGRARDRGQHEVDRGQYDSHLIVDAVSGAGVMFRGSALQKAKYPIHNTKIEFFDEDFHSYWEDVDLSWRLRNLGWKNIFVPRAIGYHGRAASSSKNGYANITGFIKHHRALPQRIRQLNYKNHIFMYIKNSKWLYPQFFVREFFMLCYILLFEISTLKILPEMFRQLPKIWKKSQLIKKLSAEQHGVGRERESH